MGKMILSSSEIGEALEQHFYKTHACFSEVKDGPTWGSSHKRMDFVAIKKTWSPVNIIICEIKVNHSDFTSDEKWPSYMDMCNRFYWVCPTGIIKKEEIDPKCGLIQVNPETKKAVTSKAAPFRKVEPDPYMLLYLLLWRLEGHRDRPSKDRGEMRSDMEKADKFGKEYECFHSTKLHEAHTRVVVAEERQKLAEKKLATAIEASKVLGELDKAGINVGALGKRGMLTDVWKLRSLVNIAEPLKDLRNDMTAILEAISESKEVEND